ncbi:MAG: hypothetical protein JRE58_04080, partial [Deltaproteobacteria bacterium]|nr:hypothetical protein [Deltaproteobacteria bacterium]
LAGELGPDQVAVAASGIRERMDIKIGLKAGIYNFLIGESLVRASDPAAMLQTLKACGQAPKYKNMRAGTRPVPTHVGGKNVGADLVSAHLPKQKNKSNEHK